MRDGNTLVGWGMATSVYPTRRSASSAEARLEADGTFLVDAGTQDLGTGTYTIMTQLAAVYNNLLGTKFKVIYGYPSGPDMTLALERGEVEGRSTDGRAGDKPHVVAVDYGSKRNIFRNLYEAGARVTIVPATARKGTQAIENNKQKIPSPA